MKDITIHNNFVNIQLNNNDEFVSIYETDYLNNNYHTMACLLTILLEYKPYFDGKLNGGVSLFKKSNVEFTYEGMYKYLYPDDEIFIGRIMSFIRIM